MLSARTLSRYSSLVTRRASFTLLELLVVIAIIAILMVLVVPPLTNLKGANDITNGAYTVKGVLEQARTYAKVNNTYSWVGFYEEGGSKTSTSPATSGNGRLVISIVGSKDGTTIYKSGTPGVIDHASPTPTATVGQAAANNAAESPTPAPNVGVIASTASGSEGTLIKSALGRREITRLAAASATTIGTTEEAKETVARALAEVTQTRTWGLMIDVIAQSGRYPPTANGLSDFVVEGEKRYWFHVAIDRFTGEVIGQQLEEVFD